MPYRFVAGLICTDQDKEPSGSPDGCSTVAILSGDDSNPKFKLNAALNEIQTTTNVIDYDTGDITYTLIVIGVDSSTRDPPGNTDNTFLISRTTGKIYLRRPVDYESASAITFSFTIEATDGGGRSTTAVVDVIITDVNDNIPICSSREYNVSVSEDVTIGTTVCYEDR
ncbi:protocadherin-3-like [Ostrea edulis]|uniref:protocadherin-3-like n=1 Tax=Ostrea edulis TaxID=37623 RepID=UPI0024AFBB17|nr:protocadherin-3-like [Ostrea edulis]